MQIWSSPDTPFSSARRRRPRGRSASMSAKSTRSRSRVTTKTIGCSVWKRTMHRDTAVFPRFPLRDEHQPNRQLAKKYESGTARVGNPCYILHMERDQLFPLLDQ